DARGHSRAPPAAPARPAARHARRRRPARPLPGERRGRLRHRRRVRRRRRLDGALMPFDHAERRARLAAATEEAGLDLLFVPRGTDPESLAGLRRDAPTYGAHGYTHDWVAGAFFQAGKDPLFCLPRLVALVHVKVGLPGEIVVFDEP